MPPVCPQKLPDVSNRREALKKMPEGRYNYLQRLIPMLRNQSEDCLFLNIYVPSSGEY
jgi:neuroligin